MRDSAGWHTICPNGRWIGPFRTLRDRNFSQRQETHVAAQRIVLTSPWKLGLFVFMLVAGTGFGLIYAYMELFGGEIDLRNETDGSWESNR